MKVSEPRSVRQLHVRLGMTGGALVGFAALLAVAVAGFARVELLARDGAQARTALCIIRSTVQDRIDGSTAFLKDHPNGIPGIPRALITDGIRRDRATLTSLRVLGCPTPKT